MRTIQFPSAYVMDGSFVKHRFNMTKTRKSKFGDNDTLSAITSSMVHADYLFLLTDVDGLYTSNPRKDP